MHKPEDLGRLWLERAEAGDTDGVLALYDRIGALYPQGSASTG
ncbi:hypothetical protein [Streptomyces sp. NBC_01483]|nr:hypothetical protein [Streptomyces sp. NBC_01483]